MEGYDDFSFVRSYLTPDERIIWRGKPEKGNSITKKDFFLLPFSLFWLGFALFWEYQAVLSGEIFMMVWGLPFVAVGVYLLFGRYVFGGRIKASTFYVITNKKLIIKSGKSIKIFQKKDLPPMELEIHKNGNGTISFYEQYYGRGSRTYTNFFSLDNIRDYVGAQNAICAMEEK